MPGIHTFTAVGEMWKIFQSLDGARRLSVYCLFLYLRYLLETGSNMSVCVSPAQSRHRRHFTHKRAGLPSSRCINYDTMPVCNQVWNSEKANSPLHWCINAAQRTASASIRTVHVMNMPRGNIASSLCIQGTPSRDAQQIYQCRPIFGDWESCRMEPNKEHMEWGRKSIPVTYRV